MAESFTGPRVDSLSPYSKVNFPSPSFPVLHLLSRISPHLLSKRKVDDADQGCATGTSYCVAAFLKSLRGSCPKTSDLPKHSNGKTGAPRSPKRTWDEKDRRSPTTAFTPAKTKSLPNLPFQQSTEMRDREMRDISSRHIVAGSCFLLL
jgi:hypothetical protein